MAEDSLRDLLERLTAFATGAANVHDKPSTIVEEVKDVLDHLARDELLAASAVLLAIDPPGALHHLELVARRCTNRAVTSTWGAPGCSSASPRTSRG